MDTACPIEYSSASAASECHQELFGKGLPDILRPNGEKVSVNGEQIEHYNPGDSTPTHFIKLERDPDQGNKVVKIYTPNHPESGGQAAVTYGYDSNGRLQKVGLLNDSGDPNPYDYVTFTYQNSYKYTRRNELNESSLTEIPGPNRSIDVIGLADPSTSITVNTCYRPN